MNHKKHDKCGFYCNTTDNTTDHTTLALWDITHSPLNSCTVAARYNASASVMDS